MSGSQDDNKDQRIKASLIFLSKLTGDLVHEEIENHDLENQHRSAETGSSFFAWIRFFPVWNGIGITSSPCLCLSNPISKVTVNISAIFFLVS
jgi:hypothetical protein